jgi:pimeloyl-ACP methyl ester carboxylesterase
MLSKSRVLAGECHAVGELREASCMSSCTSHRIHRRRGPWRQALADSAFGLADMFLPAVQDAAPHATSAVVPGAGHFLVHEAPDRVVAEINAFYPTPTP